MYIGRYINLDRNPSRRAQIEANLLHAGVAERYRRFAAVDGTEAITTHATSLPAGTLGNWLSHERVVAEHVGAAEHVHILEDDAELPTNAAAMLDGILARADAELGDWDLLFTDITPAIDTRAMVTLADYCIPYAGTQKIGLIPLHGMDFAGTGSYFVNRRSIARHVELLRGQWARGIPIDIFLRHRVSEGQLKAYVTAPFLTTLSSASSNSDIVGAYDFSHKVMELHRRAYYKDADLNAIQAELLTLLAGAKLDPFYSIFLTVHGAALSDRWKHL